jgi:hypothetical protein
MLRPQGYLRTFDGNGRLRENDTFTCKHCQKVHEVPAGHQVDYDFCRNCMGAICPSCAGNACRPFEKGLERAERMHEHRRQLLADLGLSAF